MPSVQSAADEWKTANPDLAPFLTGADYAQGVPTNAGSSDVITDFNSQLESLKTTVSEDDPRLGADQPRSRGQVAP